MHDAPLAYFITWTCYGTWLPGDERGWIKWHAGDRLPAPRLWNWLGKRLTECPVMLDREQRRIVEVVIAQHCHRRGWTLHAVNARSNHCHVVVTAVDHDGETVRDQLKAWASRRLHELELARSVPASRLRQRWWTRKGSVRHIADEDSLAAAIAYTNDAQESGGSKRNW